MSYLNLQTMYVLERVPQAEQVEWASQKVMKYDAFEYSVAEEFGKWWG